MLRRDFAISLGAGLIDLAGRLGSLDLDAVAGALLGDGASALLEPPPVVTATRLEHWRAAENGAWRWFERSEFSAGEWRLTGMTMPTEKHSGYQVSGRDCAAYLLDAEVPHAVIRGVSNGVAEFCVAVEGAAPGPAATPARRAQEGRPASHWLRRLTAGELRLWLDSLEPMQAGVSGMTFIEHLTRDHGFTLESVARLTLAELTKLHGAVHRGY